MKSQLNLAIILIFLGAGGVNAVESNHGAPVYHDLQACMEAISAPVAPWYRYGGALDKIALLSWNIEKGLNLGWKQDLRDMARDRDIVFLQEAVLTTDMQDPRKENIYWSFSPGYETSTYRSGLMTLSRRPPDLVCSFQQKEPWLGTPKTASIVRIPLGQDKAPLLLANIHSINFTLGIKSFSEQLDKLTKLLAQHKGPIILSGDLNTWKGARQKKLFSATQKLKLDAVEFETDVRVKMFGNILDYVFIRGLVVTNSQVKAVTTSDHNPLGVTLSFK